MDEGVSTETHDSVDTGAAEPWWYTWPVGSGARAVAVTGVTRASDTVS